jgi:lipopolysaccharide export system permease protein
VVKKLDILILKAFIGPFIATFFITLLVLVLQFFWLYIDDFVGKGLSTGVIFEFIWYQSAVLVPLALPLAVLLSSLMTFGNLGESFELVAIKSAGISLLRFMRPLFYVTLIICGIAFLFSNYIIPVANLKSRTLLSDIVYAKPSFDLREGIFYDKLSGFAIKVGKKEKNDTIIRDVIIYEQNNQLQDNIIIARSGVMRTSDNKRFLEFNLKDGWRYQERGNQGSTNTEFIRLGFKEYKKQFDLSSFAFTRTADSVNKNNQKMLSLRQLETAIDSLKREIKKIRTRVKNEVLASMKFVNYLDSGWNNTGAINEKFKSAKTLEELLPDSVKATINLSVPGVVSMIRTTNEVAAGELVEREKDLRLHRIEWHRKITLSIACLVLFMIGAPLGSIIRKGGLGTPLVFAIIFFMVFYFLSNMGEKAAKENAMDPVLGMWLATFLLVPMGLFLTYKALRDSQFLNKEFYFRSGRKFRKLFSKKLIVANPE